MSMKKNVACHISKQRSCNHQAITSQLPWWVLWGFRMKRDAHHQVISHCSHPHTYTVRRLGMGKHRTPATDSWGACQRGNSNEPWSFHLPTQRKGASAAPFSKESAWNAGDAGHTGLIPGSERSPGGGYGNPLQYSCWEKSMDGRAWRTSVYGVTRSWTHQKHGLACHIQREALNSLHWATLFFLKVIFWCSDYLIFVAKISVYPASSPTSLEAVSEWSEILCPRLKSSVLSNE